ncbi:hypothetical protein C7N43_27915 [Sphingobacteriales bacterium UPWRP_1]|nr:hypothetical protein BVG80_04710 [Sphingobacteriales bacterium TSM_CSM]PSJ73689.1 hypothetical protein C7N43_27915 [Sphingobacteriales bacterium UPWRP_1]
MQANLFLHFFTVSDRQNNQLGSFGALENIYQQPPYLAVAPKYQALLDFVPIIPAPVISGNNMACANQTYTYSTPAITGSTYNWTVTGGTIISGQGTNTITVQWNNGTAGTVQVQQNVP